jgi:hypothetical protein
MEEQFQQQYEQFQNGFKSVFEAGQKMSEPALRGSEVAIDSLNQLVKDQFEFGRSCMQIGQKQMEALQSADGMSALYDTNAPSEYYNAAQRYGEAVRKNAEQTCDRMMTLGREATDKAADAGNVLSEAANAATSQNKGKKSSDKSA